MINSLLLTLVVEVCGGVKKSLKTQHSLQEKGRTDIIKKNRHQTSGLPSIFSSGNI